MELNLFKNFLYDLLNESDAKILDLYEEARNDLLRVTMKNGKVFRIQFQEEQFHLIRLPNQQ